MQVRALHRGFTLIEVIVAITILGIILTSVFQIYSHISLMSKRLEMARWLQENTRNITQTIAQDIREGGIAFECYDLTNSVSGCSGARATEYTASGADILILRGTSAECAWGCFIQYYLAKPIVTGWEVACTSTEAATPGACYLIRSVVNAGGMQDSSTRLSDADTSITQLRFYISGVDANRFANAWDTEWKVTLSFLLAIAPKRGLDPETAARLTIPVQTTITQKLYKSNS
jgi:prepilin-type N-terminal cleavage/methylation domain-containing protein